MKFLRSAFPSLLRDSRRIALLGSAAGLTAVAGDFPAPATLSDAGRAALAQFSRARRDAPLPAPDDVAGWKRVQADIETSRAAANAAVVRQYEPTLASRTLGGVPVLDIQPRGWRPSRQVLVYTHGGAYTMYSSHSRLMSAVPMAADTGRRVISVDYTLAPHAQWPVVTSQVVSVIQALVAEGHALSDIAIYGESAGGGLAAGAVLKMRDAGLGMPAAVVLWSPWADITDTGDTYATLQDADPLLYYPGNLRNCAAAYAAPADQKHPYVSPVYGDYTQGFPPTLIQVGTKEIFLSNAVRQYQALDQAGVPVKLDPYEGMWHIFQVFSHDIPEAQLARRKVRAFLDTRLGAP
ncbi:MAG: alpha/beta hydrolase [Opitutaceae bacterium]|nr:alpha/beta hydrolase [Opitutaceae bacterium]